MPASSKFTDDTLNVVESHVLERNKYKSQFPTIEFRLDDPITPIMGINELTYNWGVNHHPTGQQPGLTGSGRQMLNSQWWKERAERQNSDISSGNDNVDAQRDNIRRSIENDNNQKLNILSTLSDGVHSGSIFRIRKLAKPYKLTAYRTASPVMPIRAGVNFERNKKIDLTYNALRPHGPVNQEDSKYVPENVLYSSVYGVNGEEDDTARLVDSQDPLAKPNDKVKRSVKVQFGRNWEEGIGYKNLKSDISFPFNIISGNVSTGYQKNVVARVMSGVILTNLHNDVYGPDMESPMQGPFTNYAVGGHQSRHVDVNKVAVGSNFPSGEVSMNELPDEGDTLTLNDGGTEVQFIFTGSPTNPEDVDIDGDTTTTMENLVAAINSYPGFTIRAGITSNGTASLTNFVNSPDYTIGNITIGSTGDWPYAVSGMAGGAGGSDRWDTRPEAWKILLGKCDDPPISGAIGMVGPDYPLPNAPEVLGQYPHTASEKAVYYRDYVAKRPVNIRNIHHTTGSTVLGNFEHNYQVVQAHGGYSNPRQFIERQPNLPTTIKNDYMSSSTSVRTLLDIHRGSVDGVYQQVTGGILSITGHSNFSGDYSTDYLQGGLGYASISTASHPTKNKSVFVSKFSAPGGIEVMSRGYQDFKAGEFSVYNMLNNRNLTVKRPFQAHPALSGTHPTGQIIITTSPDDRDQIALHDGDTQRIFTFMRLSFATDQTTFVAATANPVKTVQEFVRVLNRQEGFHIRGTQLTDSTGTLIATASLVNIKHYEKGNQRILVTSSFFDNTDMAGGTDGPEVDGIRVFDIHGNDYGLYNHAARHAARFFRDSVMRPTDQGATYQEAPSFHRVHRNNIARPRLATENYVMNFAGPSLDNQSQFNFGDANIKPALIAVTNNSTHQQIERFLIPAITGAGGPGRTDSSTGGAGFSWSGWINFGLQNNNTTETVFAIGMRQANSGLIRLEKRTDGGDGDVDWFFKVATETNGDVSKTNEYKWTTTNDWSGSWNHVAVVWGQPKISSTLAQPPQMEMEEQLAR